MSKITMLASYKEEKSKEKEEMSDQFIKVDVKDIEKVLCSQIDDISNLLKKDIQALGKGQLTKQEYISHMIHLFDVFIENINISYS